MEPRISGARIYGNIAILVFVDENLFFTLFFTLFLLSYPKMCASVSEQQFGASSDTFINKNVLQLQNSSSDYILNAWFLFINL